jgi:hypothetical protein
MNALLNCQIFFAKKYHCIIRIFLERVMRGTNTYHKTVYSNFFYPKRKDLPDFY